MAGQDGTATFSYTGKKTGTDIITASFTNDEGETVSTDTQKTWGSEKAGYTLPVVLFFTGIGLIVVFGVVIFASRRHRH